LPAFSSHLLIGLKRKWQEKARIPEFGKGIPHALMSANLIEGAVRIFE